MTDSRIETLLRQSVTRGDRYMRSSSRRAAQARRRQPSYRRHRLQRSFLSLTHRLPDGHRITRRPVDANELATAFERLWIEEGSGDVGRWNGRIDQDVEVEFGRSGGQ